MDADSFDLDRTLRMVAERAQADPSFLQLLLDDPRAAVEQIPRDAGLTPDELRAALGLGGAADAPLVESLAERLSRLGFVGGGGSFGGAGAGGGW